MAGLSVSHLIAFTSVGLLLGQGGALPPLSEAEFRSIVQKVVADGPVPIDNRAFEFVQRHDDVAVPILVEGIRARWARRPPEDRALPVLLDQVEWRPAARPNQADSAAVAAVVELLDLATRLAEQRAIAAVGQLCADYQTDCRFFVHQLLLNAISQEHYFTPASELVRQYPGVADMTVAYVESALTSGGAANLYAQQLQERVESGEKIESDVILPRLSPVSREKVMRALDNLNQDRQKPQ